MELYLMSENAFLSRTHPLDVPSTDEIVYTQSQADTLNNLLAAVAPELSNKDKILSATPVWPLACNAFSAVFCMGCSALFHLMYVRSRKTESILSRLDYGGISVLIYGSTIPIIYYCFPCENTKGKLLNVLTSFSCTDCPPCGAWCDVHDLFRRYSHAEV
jgi:hypothetical protein